MSKIRVILADDHKIVRESIAKMLDASSGIVMVGQATDGYEALHLIRDCQPDVALLDVSLAKLNSLELIVRIRQECPTTRVLMLSMHNNISYVVRHNIDRA
ncbi:MAG: response regulator transcription factor [Chloroflexota bacterium]